MALHEVRSPLAVGPLQAFAAMHRGMREGEKRLLSLRSELLSLSDSVDAKIEQTERKLAVSERDVREEARGAVAAVEEVLKQVYQEHRTALAQQQELRLALRAAQEEGVRRQAEMDELGAVVRQQQQMISEHLGGSSARLSVLEKQLSTLDVKARIDGVREETLRSLEGAEARIIKANEVKLNRLEAAVRQQADAMGTTLARQGAQIDSVITWRPQIMAREEEASEKLTSSHAQLEALNERMRVMEEGGGEGGRVVVERACAMVRDELLQLVVSSGREMEGRQAKLDSRLTALAQQLHPLLSEHAELSSRVKQLGSQLESRGAREEKLLAKQLEGSRLTEQLGEGVAEAHAVGQANQQALASALHALEEMELQMRSLQSNLARITSASEEQARYLHHLSESLFQQKLVPQKFRSTAILLPSAASSPSHCDGRTGSRSFGQLPFAEAMDHLSKSAVGAGVGRPPLLDDCVSISTQGSRAQPRPMSGGYLPD
ncbi:MAG: hypothetical protein SGPRY_008850 [Prymnesium sp.]